LRNSNTSPSQIVARLGQIVLVLLILCAGSAYPIDPNRAMSQYIHEQWGTEQGFPSGPVYAIAQSADGYLWIGTRAGLVRFDGLNFRLIDNSLALLRNESILNLTSDSSGDFWVRSEGTLLSKYRDGAFSIPTSLRAQLQGGITAMSRAKDGALMLSLDSTAIVVSRGDKLEKIADGSSMPRSPLLALAQTSDGSVWVGTRGAGLFRLHNNETSSITEGLPDPKINCLLPDARGGLWIGTDSGAAYWNGSRLTADKLPDSIKHMQVLALLKDRDGNIWVGTDSGDLLRLNNQGVSSLGLGEGRSHQAVTAAFEDREGNLWIGSDSRLDRLRDSAFVTYSRPEGLPSDGSNPIFVDEANRLWFPPVAGGLWWMKDGAHGHVTSAGLEKDVIYSIDGGKNELWLGRQRGGLTQLSLQGESFAAKSYTQGDGLAQNSVYSVYRARDGTVWAGTLSGGLSALRNGRFTNYSVANGLAANTVASILETSDGAMWFATPNGLSTFFKGRWQTYAAGDGLPSRNVNCLLQDSAGVLWVGTATGLAFKGPRGFQVFAEWPDALRSQVLGLAEDRYGSLWIATSNDVLRVNRDKLRSGGLGEGDVREFGLADGLRGVEGVKRDRSVIADRKGLIWFSLNRGISVVDPARLKQNSTPAVPHIEAILADGSPVELGPAIHIPGGHQRIAFDFTGLSLSVPERVRFRYMLEGNDRSWSKPIATREAGYTNLAPSHYRFRIMASNPDGVWSPTEADVAFDVDPMFWQIWWVRAGSAALCLIALVALYRFRLHKATRQLNLAYAERLDERTRIAQELHDTLLQGFLSASMQVHVAADQLTENSQTKAILNRALQVMGQVVDEGRKAVRGLRSTESASLDLEHAFSLIQQEIVPKEQAGASLEFRVIVDGEQRPLRPLLRDEVYRIGREALINAFRHAHAKRIEMEINYSSRRLRMLVRDDGLGINPEVVRSGLEGHWGLSGMRERADRIGASLNVWSSPTAGTEIELTVPSRIAFEDHNDMLTWFWKPFRRNGADRPPKSRTEQAN